MGAPRNDDGSRTFMPLDDIGEVLNCVIEGRAVTVKKQKKKTTAKKRVAKKTTKKVMSQKNEQKA